MTYMMGGKKVIGKEIARFIKHEILNNDPTIPYVEPFVGMCGIMQHMTEGGQRPCYAMDLHPDIIALWQAVQTGWHPPQGEVTKKDYDRWKLEPLPSAMRAFVGFGCSYSGKYFGGYVKPRPKERPRWEKNRTSLERVIPKIYGAQINFTQGDYRQLDPSSFPLGTLIVCDPPYAKTTGFTVGKGFDHEEFWQRMREWSRTHKVLICEQTAPDDFVSLWQRPITRNMHFSKREEQVKTENLFMHSSLLKKE